MSNLLLDSFDYYDQVLDKWDTASSQIDTITTTKRNGARALRVGPTGQFLTGKTLVKNIGNTHSGCVLGVAFLHPGFTPGGPATTAPFIDLRGGSTTQVKLKMNSSSQIDMIDGSHAVIGTSTTVLSSSIWYYLELRVVCDSASGTAQLRINNTEEVTVTGTNTDTAGTGYVDTIALGDLDDGGGLAVAGYYDDLYFNNLTGTYNNDYWGDTVVTTLYVANSGTNANWTVTGTANNYQAVDDALPNEEVDYVYTTLTGTLDSYVFDTLTTSGSITSLAVNLNARKDGAGDRAITQYALASGTNTATGTDDSLTQTYITHWHIFEEDPDTNTAWTTASVNAAEFGTRMQS